MKYSLFAVSLLAIACISCTAVSRNEAASLADHATDATETIESSLESELRMLSAVPELQELERGLNLVGEGDQPFWTNDSRWSISDVFAVSARDLPPVEEQSHGDWRVSGSRQVYSDLLNSMDKDSKLAAFRIAVPDDEKVLWHVWAKERKYDVPIAIETYSRKGSDDDGDRAGTHFVWHVERDAQSWKVYTTTPYDLLAVDSNAPTEQDKAKAKETGTTIVLPPVECRMSGNLLLANATELVRERLNAVEMLQLAYRNFKNLAEDESPEPFVVGVKAVHTAVAIFATVMGYGAIANEATDVVGALMNLARESIKAKRVARASEALREVIMSLRKLLELSNGKQKVLRSFYTISTQKVVVGLWDVGLANPSLLFNNLLAPYGLSTGAAAWADYISERERLEAFGQVAAMQRDRLIERAEETEKKIQGLNKSQSEEARDLEDESEQYRIGAEGLKQLQESLDEAKDNMLEERENLTSAIREIISIRGERNFAASQLVVDRYISVLDVLVERHMELEEEQPLALKHLIPVLQSLQSAAGQLQYSDKRLSLKE